MAITYIETKDGKTYSGPIKLWRPSLGWFSIDYFGDDEYGIEQKFYFSDIKSAITKNERTNIYSTPIGQDVDELERAREDLRQAREYGWGNFTKETPKFDWE